MPAKAVVFLICGVLVSIAASAQALGGTDAASVCKPGPTKAAGGPAIAFCGPAHATVKLGGKTVTFKNGACKKGPNYVIVELGISIVGLPRSNEPDYFKLVVGYGGPTGKGPYSYEPAAPKDGTYKGGTILVVTGGHSQSYAGQPTITLKQNRSVGTFSTVTFDAKQPVTGSFACT